MPAGTKFKVEEKGADGFTVSATSGEKTTDGAVFTGETSGEYTLVTFNNSRVKEKIEATAVKAWLNADGTNTPPSGASVTFELFADGVTTGKTVTLNGKVDVAANPIEAQELIATAGK